MAEFELDAFLPYRLAVSAEQVSRGFFQLYHASHGISRAEWRIICHLACAEGGLSVCDLEKEANLEKTKASRGVSKLEARGWVKKSRHRRDARLLSISLTNEGLRVFEALVPMARDFQSTLEARLSKSELKTLASALQKLSR